MDKLKKALKNPVVMYAIIISLLVLSDSLLDIQLELVGNLLHYQLNNPFPKYIRYAIWHMILSRPLWIVIILKNHNSAEKKDAVWKITSGFIHFAGILSIVLIGPALIDKAAYVNQRYNHSIAQANKRFEPKEIYSHDIRYFENGEVIYEFSYKDLALDCIVYIYDRENPDFETDSYIKKLITTQPLRLYKLEKQQAAEVMLHNRIETAPAVIMIVDHNNDVMEGYDEISMLETKIHNYKKQNRYFY